MVDVMAIDFLYVFTVLASVVVSMTLHEAMHAYASYWLGDHTAKSMGRLSINPITHIDPVMTLLLPVGLALLGSPVIFGGAKPVPFNPYALKYGEWGMALVALAGPLTNLLLAFVSFGIMSIFIHMGSMDVMTFQMFKVFIGVNLGFFIFNMIPIPPLDGSRLLYVIAPDSVRNWMTGMEQFGIILIFSLLLLTGNAMDVFIGNFSNFIFEVFSKIFLLV